jgi:hypothetical protein
MGYDNLVAVASGIGITPTPGAVVGLCKLNQVDP